MKKFIFTFLIIIGYQYMAAQTFTCGTSMLTDIDGFQYHTVLMGSRCWTKENMRTTHYANGQPAGIPEREAGFRESINMPGKLNVYINLLTAEKIHVDIYNADGKQVYGSILKCNAGGNVIDFIIGPPGFYMVKLSSETIKSTFKVIGSDHPGIEATSMPSTPEYKSDPFELKSNPRFYYDYNNDPVNDEKFGKLYTWASALNVEYGWNVTLDTVIQGICPNGWHVSNDTDWMQLELYKGMTPDEIDLIFVMVRGTIALTLQTSDTTYWKTAWGTGDAEFSARGAGIYILGEFVVLKEQTNWLTYSPHWGPMIRNMAGGSGSIIRDQVLLNQMDWAYSVRCVKDY
ncbi:MAG: FISUMP domain-containing protein [Bacteroidota bacterium]